MRIRYGFERLGARLTPLFAVGALLVATGVSADDMDWRALWKRGLAAFKKKDYESACQLFASAVAAQPKNAAIWGDLGLCQYKEGSTGASIHASRFAARFGDEGVRKAAYYNLGLAGDSVKLPNDACGELSPVAEAQCKKPVFACTKSWNGSGTVFHQSGTVAFFGRTLAEAQAGADGMSELDPTANEVGAGLALSEEADDSCGSWCDMHEWEIDDASPIKQQVLACIEKRKGPYPGPPDPCVRERKRCADPFECAGAVFSHSTDTKAIGREWERLHGKCVSDCTSNTDDAPKPACRVVYADACRGYVGAVCETPKKQGQGSTLVASELELSEP